jgi:DNA-binding MarR family transcriptional regulator
MKVRDLRLFREKMRRLQRDLGWQWKSDAGCCGITTAQCHALLEVGEKGEISLVELAGILGLDTSTLSRTMDGMVQSGLVERHLNPSDRRYVSISLTAHGRAVYDEIDRTFNNYFKVIFEMIPEEKREQVLESFALLVDAVHQSCSRCCKEESANER